MKANQLTFCVLPYNNVLGIRWGRSSSMRHLIEKVRTDVQNNYTAWEKSDHLCKQC
jgi:hypothetical protein